jgi:hypothetical protein
MIRRLAMMLITFAFLCVFCLQHHYFRIFTNQVVKTKLYIMGAANTAAPNLRLLPFFPLAFAPDSTTVLVEPR